MSWNRFPAHVRGQYRTAIPVLLVLALLLAACGTSAPGATPTTGSAATATPLASPLPAPAVTLADNGKTIVLQVGQQFLLDLGEEYTWTVTVSDPAIVSRVVNVTVIRGAQGLYETHQVGSTMLTAVGDPVCRQSQPPCAAPSIQFTINITVQ
jgi:hypothetical protein